MVTALSGGYLGGSGGKKHKMLV